MSVAEAGRAGRLRSSSKSRVQERCDWSSCDMAGAACRKGGRHICALLGLNCGSSAGHIALGAHSTVLGQDLRDCLVKNAARVKLDQMS